MAALALGVALTMPMSAAATTGTDDGADTGTTEEGSAPEDGAETGEAPPSDDTDDDTDGEGEGDDATPEDDATEEEDEGEGGDSWHGYGGQATGPQELTRAPADSNYPVPQAPEAPPLPAEIDAFPGLDDNLLCDPIDRPGVIAFGNLVADHYDRPYYSVSRQCSGVRSLHHEGRALDWPLNAHDPQERRIGDEVVHWLTENDGEMAARFGIRSIIWNHQTWRLDEPSIWRGYVGVSPHTDHIHFSFTWDGAQMRTSWWTQVAVTEPDLGPCAVVAGAYAALPQAPNRDACQATGTVSAPSTEYQQILPGGSGAGLDLVQPLLDVPQTDVLDDATRAALVEWQGEQGIPQTGILDQFSYAAALGMDLPQLPDEALATPLGEFATTEFSQVKHLELAEGDTGPEVELLQQALGIEADGNFGPQTAQALLDFSTEQQGLRASESTDELIWTMLERQTYPTLVFRDHELAEGDNGPLVQVVQEVLGLEVDGSFGPQTRQAIERAQHDADLEATGVVDAATWAAIDPGEPFSLYYVDDRGRTWFRGSLLWTVDDLPVADR